MHLSQDCRLLLRVVLVAGGSVLERDAARVADMKGDRLWAAIEEAQRSGLLTASGGVISAAPDAAAAVGEFSLGTLRSMHAAFAALSIGKSPPDFASAGRHAAASGDEVRGFEWLELAGDAAGKAGDLGAAIAIYSEAIERCPSAGAEAGTRIVEKTSILGRHWVRPLEAEPMIRAVLDRSPTADQRGRVLFAHGLILGYAGEEEKRTKVLLEARSAFDAAGNFALAARTCGALAIPTDDTMTIEERIEIGQEGLMLAERAGDRDASAHCAGNLAGALLLSGDDRAFELWGTSIEWLADQRSAVLRDDAVRYLNIWAAGLIAFGRSKAAIQIIRRARRRPMTEYWSKRLSGIEAVALWRTGQWDEAARALDAAGEDDETQNSPVVPSARAVGFALAFERDRTVKPIPQPWIQAVVTRGSISSAGAALGIAARIRQARREPSAHRGIPELIERVVRQRARVGWDDLLPIVAEIDPRLFRRVTALTEGLGPVGERVHANQLAAQGLVASRTGSRDASDILIQAADEYERLGEPYPQAKMLQAAAGSIVHGGGRAGNLRARAARIYAALGADRSLASLLRTSGRTRALEAIRVPGSQTFASNPGLTPREHDVAELAAAGYPASEIAHELGISQATARTHLARVKVKLGAKRKSDLVRLLGPMAR